MPIFLGQLLLVGLFVQLSIGERCQLPPAGHVFMRPMSSAPCVHPGQPLMSYDSVSKDLQIRSPFVSFDHPVFFASQRMCFYDEPIEIPYEYSCGTSAAADGGRGRWKPMLLLIRHPKYTTSVKPRRVKRFLRRRNPLSSVIHFQQENYIREMPEDSSVDSPVVTVKATHASGSALYYSMMAPQDSRSQNVFSLDTMSGEIRLAKSLDREVLEKHVLKVTAYERTDPTISASTTVTVEVKDVQDNSPIFERNSYFADIREDAPIGTTVLSVFARDMDAGENGQIEYLLGEGDGAELLAINSKSGVVQTNAPLDRETLQMIRLDVIARDHGVPRRESSALIEISILDVNDNAPVFEQDAYNVTVAEDVQTPLQIAVVHAIDKDADANGKVHYSLVASQTLPITIDYSTGAVTLRSRLDASHSPLTVIVRAKDGAQPALSSTVPLNIHIVDINDHKPTFIAAQKIIFLEESVSVGEEVGRVYAIDEDSGDNGRIRYSMDGHGDFSIDEQSGVIRTVKELDRERTAKYELMILAQDGGAPPLNSSTAIEIIIKDANDNAPQFEQSQYNISISENSPRGSQILKLKAIDRDENQKIVYRIEGDEAGKGRVAIIDMGDEGALLSLSSALHNDHFIKVQVLATDQGGLQGRCTVNIIVEDVNSPPYFLPHPYTVKIPEHSPIGFPVILLKAEDSDRGANAQLHYSLDSTCFNISHSTGQIVVACDIDRETKASFPLSVNVTDSAPTPLTTTTQIEVIVDDVNDNPPIFSSANYETSISEDIPVGTSFIKISAEDADAGENGIIDYFINETASGPGSDLFRLDRTSGTLRVNQLLDRESIPIIILSVYASDRGSPSLSSTSLVTIKLVDVNDNPPRFEQSVYDLYIAENSPIGSTVGTIVATDPDEAENANIEFRIVGGTDARLFDIETSDTNRGVVRILTRSVFDYEAKTNKFQLEVQASSGELSSTATLRIHVSDANDNQPILKDFTLLINTYEEGSHQKEIGSIPAFDPDQNATLEFYLEENALIEADKYTGKLRLKRMWKRSIETTLKACVSDGPNTACSKCQLIHMPVATSWLRQSVTLSLRGITLDSFWDKAVFNRFRESLSTLSNWSPRAIRVISASSVGDNVLVSFAVAPEDTPIRAWNVEERIKAESKRIERMALIKMDIVKEESCAKEPCAHYQKCREALKYVNEMQFHQTDNFLARTLKTVNTFVCECPNGFTTSSRSADSCDTRIDLCFDAPCLHNGTCHSLENTYRCECKQPWTGDRCETSRPLTCLPGYCSGGSNCILVEGKDNQVTRMKCENCAYRKEDTDKSCRLRAVNFDGQGILNINRDPSRIEWTVEMSIATISQNGVIMFTGNRKSDFMEVSLKNRILEVEFSLGGNSKSIRMKNVKENQVNDGKWHRVRLEFYDKKLIISLDDCDTQASLLVTSSHCSAQLRAELPAKCVDPTVPCFRFLDTNNGLFFGGRPSGVRHVEEGYQGCLSNVTIDGDVIDLSSEHVDRNTGVQDGCTPLHDNCHAIKCPRGRRCHSKWNGHVCHCAHSVHNDKEECSSESISPLSRPISLMDEESFISLKIPHSINPPFHFSSEFRTSRDDIQLFVIEFEQRNVFYKLEISNGLLRSSLSSHSAAFIDSPLIPIGHWFKVDVEFTRSEIITTFDGIYKLVQSVDLPDVAVEMIYSGVAPSTGHPSRFEGCVRGISLNDEPLTIREKSKVRTGCIVTNRCSLEGVCPRESRCHSKFDQHECVCHSGYISDSCVSACSFKGICGVDGTCIRSNNSRGYECLCATGLRGVNCERSAPEQMCPIGYWGNYPNCRQCGCDLARGYEQQCEQATGECRCRKGYFSTPFGCVACECGYGTTSIECDKDGQCQCKGDAVGRRCDRCRKSNEVLDPKSLKCHRVKDRCPSEIDYGIQWPTTLKGRIARQSCSNGEIGLATRLCADTGKWEEVNSWNCTKHEYSIMVSKFDVLGSFELLEMLKNATKKDVYIRGKNQQIAAIALLKIIEKENRLKCHEKSHVKDSSFSLSLLDSAAKILQSESSTEYLRLGRKLFDFGRLLFECHQDMSFLNPFQIVGQDFLFTVDRLDYSHTLPKFNNLLDLRPPSFPHLLIRLPSDCHSFAFFSILTKPKCTRCSSPIVAVQVNTTGQIRVEFPLAEDNDWKYPECARLQGFDDSSWTARDANLVGLNMTHAVCEFTRSGIYTLLTAAHKGVYLRFSHSSSHAAPILIVISILLCILSLVLTFTRRGIKTHLIRVGFILFFAIDIVNLFLVHSVSVSQVFCPARNAFLSFTTSAPFGWLLLYSLHIYRMLSDGSTRTSSTVCLLLGLVLPCLFSCFVFIFTSSCSMAPSGWLFWFILLPIGLFLLLSFYSSATCLLVTIHKQYDAYVMKFNLRKALIQHFILSTMLLINTALGLLLPRGIFPTHIEELLCSISFVATALYITLWSACPGKNREVSMPVAMWVEDEKKMTGISDDRSGRGTDGVGRHCDSPLLYETEDESTTCANWMDATVAGSEHHERRLISQQLATNHILSPADKILNEGLGHVYDNMGTLSRIRTERDEADDAYYTYTISRRYKPTTFAS